MTNHKRPPAKRKAPTKPKPKKKAKKRVPRVMKDSKGFYFMDPKGKKFRVEGSANYHLGNIQKAVFNAYARPPPRKRRAAAKKKTPAVSSGPDAWGISGAMPFSISNALRDEGLKNESKAEALQQELKKELQNYAKSDNVHGAMLEYDRYINSNYEPRRPIETPITSPTPGPIARKAERKTRDEKQSDALASIMRTTGDNTIIFHKTPATPARTPAKAPQTPIKPPAPQTPTVDVKFGPSPTAESIAAALEAAAEKPPAVDSRTAMLLGLRDKLDNKEGNRRGQKAGLLTKIKPLVGLTQSADEDDVRKALAAALAENPTGAGKFASEGMSDVEIMHIMKGMKKYDFQGVIMADEIHLLKPKKEMSFIMNLGSSKTNGTHWVAVFISSHVDVTLEYYDSLSQPMSSRFLRDIKHYIIDKLRPPMLLKIKENRIRDQSLNTSTCGLFAIKFLKDRYRGKSFAEASGYRSVPEAERSVLRFEKHI